MKNKMSIGIIVLALLLLAGVYWWTGRDVAPAAPIDRPETSSGQPSTSTTEAKSTTEAQSTTALPAAGSEYRISMTAVELAPVALGRVIEENGNYVELSMEMKSYSAFAPGQATIVYQEIDRKPSDHTVAEILWIEMDHSFQMKEADVIENPKEITYRFKGRIYRGDLIPMEGEQPTEESGQYYLKYRGRLLLTDLPEDTETTPIMGER